MGKKELSRGNYHNLGWDGSLTTMCGHGLIANSFAQKMIDRVKEERLTPEKAARYMAKLCVCGAFNTSRAERILHEARMSAPEARIPVTLT